MIVAFDPSHVSHIPKFVKEIALDTFLTAGTDRGTAHDRCLLNS